LQTRRYPGSCSNIKDKTVKEPNPKPHMIDLLTVIAISSPAYLLATFLHEMGGHGLTCLILGGRLAELSAFYASCDYTGMTDGAIRMVALAGPLVSLILGLVCFIILPRIAQRSFHWKYFLWLLATLGLLTATGYLMFSGVSGLGDFGTSRDGALFQAAPEWIWRVGIGLAGLVGYFLVVLSSVRQMDHYVIGGGARERVIQAQRLSMTSYLTGGVVSVLIGLLNPVGIIIVLISAAAASLGGTSALLWMMQLMDRKKDSPAIRLEIRREWTWIVAGVLFTAIYAIVLGPTVYLR
jgi:hypothetical protein